jgi:hypothetical protein
MSKAVRYGAEAPARHCFGHGWSKSNAVSIFESRCSSSVRSLLAEAMLLQPFENLPLTRKKFGNRAHGLDNFPPENLSPRPSA